MLANLQFPSLPNLLRADAGLDGKGFAHLMYNPRHHPCLSQSQEIKMEGGEGTKSAEGGRGSPYPPPPSLYFEGGLEEGGDPLRRQ